MNKKVSLQFIFKILLEAFPTKAIKTLTGTDPRMLWISLIDDDTSPNVFGYVSYNMEICEIYSVSRSWTKLFETAIEKAYTNTIITVHNAELERELEKAYTEEQKVIEALDVMEGENLFSDLEYIKDHASSKRDDVAWSDLEYALAEAEEVKSCRNLK